MALRRPARGGGVAPEVGGQGRGDRRRGGPGERAPGVGAGGTGRDRPGVEGRADVDVDDEVAGGEDPQQRRREGVVADEGGRGVDGPLAAAPVPHGHRHHGPAGVVGGLEGGRPEGPEVAAAAGGALGEHADRGAVAQRRGQAGDGVGQGPQPVAVEEHRAGARRDDTEQRPPADLALGEHPDRGHGVQGHDVEPGDVVGDDERPGRRLRTTAPHADPARGEHRARPEGLHPPERRRPEQGQHDGHGEAREQHGDERDGADGQPGEATGAVPAAQGLGDRQAARVAGRGGRVGTGHTPSPNR